MKTASFFFVLVAIAAGVAPTLARDAAARSANTVVLDETGVRNLRIETTVVEPSEFEETLFALGRIEVYPGNRAVVSSRIAGRAREVRIRLDHTVERGEVAVVVESRQPGEPPPLVELTSPIGGLVSAVHVVTGEPVTPDKALADILDLRQVYALARVPETEAARLRPGQRAHITVAAVAGGRFPAVLEHLGAMADPTSGTVEAAFRVDNPELALRPGMRAEFSIVTGLRGDVSSVPRGALQGAPANRFVYVKDFEVPNAFVRAPVVVGASNDRAVEIVSGLLPGDEVVTRGAYSLAFAGGGSLSLKEALDAAHGHEHAADGSELSAGGEKKTDDPEHDHDHEHAHDEHAEGHGWKILSLVLFAALLAALFRRRPAVAGAAN